MPLPTSRYRERLLRRIDIPAWQEDRQARPAREVLEAFTGSTIAQVPVGTVDDVTSAFERARAAQRPWAARPTRERARILRRFADLVHLHQGVLLDINQAETGKNRASAMEELVDVLLNARFYAAHGPEWLAPAKVASAVPGLTRASVHYEPRGVVGVISPWNYPLSLAICDGIAAIMAGCAVVMKPDSTTPLTALAAVELLDEAGLPRDLWQVVPGQGSVVGSAIADQCDYLMFTGSSATGAHLGEQVGRRLVGFSAELGGKNPMIVGAGTDLAWVSDIAVRACFANAGQLCISIERIYVEDAAYDAFCATFAERVGEMTLGAGYDFAHEMGSLTSAAQLATITEHVDDAVAKGARVLAGGRARPDLGPFFYEPTVLADVPETAMCYRAETFGPVVAIYRARDLDDAVAQANDSEYGLNSSVFCATDEEGYAVAQRLRTGMCNVNEGYAAAWSALGGPSGGMGISGMSYRHGVEGLRKYTHARTIAVQSRRMSLGGPSALPSTWWPRLLEQGSNLMRFLPR